MNNITIVTTTLIACVLIGCKTDYDSFEEYISVGISSDQVKSYLEKNQISYQFSSCEEIEKQMSVPKIKCTHPDAINAYRGYVNNGSYMLGMGSSDVEYQVEIDNSNKVVEIHINEIYTFL